MRISSMNIFPGDWDAMVEQEDPEQPTPVPEISAAMQPGAPPAYYTSIKGEQFNK